MKRSEPLKRLISFYNYFDTKRGRGHHYHYESTLNWDEPIDQDALKISEHKESDRLNMLKTLEALIHEEKYGMLV